MAFSDPNIISRFAGKRVMIVGDIVADQYLNGTIERVSREAPVFIMRHDSTVTLPGAGANAAANIASLGGEPILIGLIGSDANGEMLNSALESANIARDNIIYDPNSTTTTKVRVLAGQRHANRQQVIRIDYESKAITDTSRDQIIEKIVTCASNVDSIVVSDYGYGVADEQVFDAIKNAAAVNGIPVIVDSRFRLLDFVGATAATPNQEEVEQILGKGFDSTSTKELRNRLGLDALLITNGSKGMQLVERDSDELNIDAVGSLQPVDVTGAGDTVIATFSLAVAAGASFANAAQIANHAGGIVVMKKGTATVDPAELVASINVNQQP